MPRKNARTLIKNNANHHLSFQRVVILLLMEGLAWILMVAD
jgi:hypothetical protein